MTTYSLRIYVVDRSPTSLAARRALRALCDLSVPGDHEIEVVDVTERPELAEQERVLATPTVIRLSPPPVRRVVGDLSDPQLAAAALDLPLAAGRASGRGVVADP